MWSLLNTMKISKMMYPNKNCKTFKMQRRKSQNSEDQKETEPLGLENSKRTVSLISQANQNTLPISKLMEQSELTRISQLLSHWTKSVTSFKVPDKTKANTLTNIHQWLKSKPEKTKPKNESNK